MPNYTPASISHYVCTIMKYVWSKFHAFVQLLNNSVSFVFLSTVLSVSQTFKWRKVQSCTRVEQRFIEDERFIEFVRAPDASYVIYCPKNSSSVNNSTQLTPSSGSLTTCMQTVFQVKNMKPSVPPDLPHVLLLKWRCWWFRYCHHHHQQQQSPSCEIPNVA